MENRNKNKTKQIKLVAFISNVYPYEKVAIDTLLISEEEL